jgi:hypothetical protein
MWVGRREKQIRNSNDQSVMQTSSSKVLSVFCMLKESIAFIHFNDLIYQQI